MSAAAIPLNGHQEFYAPEFQFVINGQPVSREITHDVLEVVYRDHVDQIDSFEIKLNALKEDNINFQYIDDNTFQPGKELEVWMGYFGRDDKRLMIKGEIVSLQPTFPTKGPSSLTIGGLNLLHRLRDQQESHAYENLTDTQIARQIANRLGIELRSDSSAAAGEERYKYLFQDNQYDIVYLMGRARRIGYDLFIEEKGRQGRSEKSTLYFGPSVNVRRKTYRLKFGTDLIEFRPYLCIANQVSEVVVRGWDNEKKEKIEARAGWSDIKSNGIADGQTSLEKTLKRRKEIVATCPILSQQEARIFARETMERMAKNLVRAEGEMLGLPDLQAGTVLEMEGLGKRFSGRYFVESTEHALCSDHYITKFQCRLENI